MHKAVKAHWVAKYKDQPVTDDSDDRPAKRATVFDVRLGRAPAVTPGKGDDFDKFVSGLPVLMYDCKATSLLQWWSKVGPKALQRMAYDYLSIPCTSCECERCFSSAKRTMTFERMSMKDETVKECELLRNWWRQGVIVPSSSHTPYGDSDDEMGDHLPDMEGLSDSD